MPGSIIDRGFKTGIGGFLAGAASVFWGLRRMMQDSELRGLAVIPFGLTLLVYAGLLTAVFFVTPWLFEGLKPEGGYQLWLWWSAVVIAVIAMLALAAILFTAVVELVGGPFYDKMAVRLLDEQGIGWSDPGFVKGAVPDLLRSLVLAVPAFVCWALGFIPAIGLFFWAIGMLIAWFGLGASAINPALQMTGHQPGQRNRWFLRYLSTTLGVGAVIAASLFIPLLGIISIPAAVIGSTQLYLKTGDRTPM